MDQETSLRIDYDYDLTLGKRVQKPTKSMLVPGVRISGYSPETLGYTCAFLLFASFCMTLISLYWLRI